MKTYIPYSLLLAAASCGMAFGAATAYTTPVGYVSTDLLAGQYNFYGLTLHQTVVAAGILSGSTASSVTASGSLDFTTLLTPGKVYILELPDGTVQEITSWSGSTLTTPENISAFVTNGVTKFNLRPSATVSSVFGAANSAGLKSSQDGDPATADNIIVYSAPGVGVSVYFFDANGNGLRDVADSDGWYTGGGDIADDLPISYPDGMIVQRLPGTTKTITLTGEVKKVPTKSIIGPGYNFLSSVSPAGLTLLASGLQGYLSTSADGDPATVDNIIMDVAGVQTSVYYFDANQNGLLDVGDGDGWYTGGGDIANAYALSGGFYIINLGGSKSYKINVPASYSTL